MTAADILSDELTRTRRLLEHERALRTVADMQVQAERDFCDAIAGHLTGLLLALAEADVVVVNGHVHMPPPYTQSAEADAALAHAINDARVLLDGHHEARFGAL